MDPERFRLQRLQIELEQLGCLHKMIEGTVPLGFDPLDDAAAQSGHLGETNLQPVTLIAGRFQLSAGRRELPLRLGESPVGAGQFALGKGADGFQLLQGCPFLGECLEPFTLLSCQQGGIAFQLLQLRRKGAGCLFCLGTAASSSLESFR